jgi:hypothetical protein
MLFETLEDCPKIKKPKTQGIKKKKTAQDSEHNTKRFRNPKSLQKKLALIQDYATQEYIIETHENCPKTRRKNKKKKTTVQDSEHNNNNNDIEIVENYYPTLNLCLLQKHLKKICKQTDSISQQTVYTHVQSPSKHKGKKNHKICRGVSSASVFLLREGGALQGRE